MQRRCSARRLRYPGDEWPSALNRLAAPPPLAGVHHWVYPSWRVKIDNMLIRANKRAGWKIAEQVEGFRSRFRRLIYFPTDGVFEVFQPCLAHKVTPNED